MQSMGKKEDQGLYLQVVLVITSYRYRLADVDGISAKAAIDGLVKRGLFADDTTEIIKEIRYKQNKISKHEGEKVVIDIYRGK